MILVKFLIVATFAVALANAQNNSIIFWNSVDSSSNIPLMRNDDYINANRRQYNSYIQNFELEIETFKDLYTERIKILELQCVMLLNTLSEIDKRLYPLELLSDFSKNCVNSHKSLIPSLVNTKTSLQNCIAAASNQLYSLHYRTSTTLKSLDSYYKNNFEKLIENCGSGHGNIDNNYTLCITNAIAVTNSYSQTMQNSFSTQMESARVSAQSYINQAVQCIFSMQNQTVSLITKASILIERCVLGLDKCDSLEGYYCKNFKRLSLSLQDLKNATIKNPFQGRNETIGCLVFDTKQN